MLWLVVLAAGGGGAWGGEEAWTSSGPEGGPVEALVVDPTAGSTLYAATRHNAVFRSPDGGATWVAAGSGLPRLVHLLAVTANGDLFASGGDGIFKSSDGGGSWLHVRAGPVTSLATGPAPGSVWAGTLAGAVVWTDDGGASWSSSGQGLPQVPVVALVVDPLTPSTLYLGAESSGIYKSTDGGVSWVAKNQNIADANVESLVIDPSTPAKLYLASDLGTFKSGNGGDSWSAFGPPDVLVERLEIDPGMPSNLLAGAYGRIFRSTDGGTNWTEIGSGVPPAAVLALAVDPTDSSTLYAGTGSGVLRSLDTGASWAAINQGLRSVRVERLAVDPIAPATVYAASPESGIFKSTDAGGSWNPAGTGLGDLAISDLALAPSLPQRLYAAQMLGLRRSQDGGTSWADPVTDPDDFGFNGPQVVSSAVDPLAAGRLFVFNLAFGRRDGPGGPGVLLSLDGAVSWDRVFEPPEGLSSLVPGELAIDPSDPSAVLAGLGGFDLGSFSSIALIFRSLDGGSTWEEQLRRAGSGFIGLDHDPLAPATVYALVSPGPGFSVLRSLDGGGSWADLPVALPCVNDLLPDPMTAGTLWAACDPVYTSPDGGAGWTAFDATGFPAGVGGALELAFAPGAAPTLHAGTSIGVYSYSLTPQADLAVSKDDGLTELAPGDPLAYTVTVTNLGPAPVTGAAVGDVLDSDLTCTWSCVASGGGVCDPAPPAGDLSETVDLPVGAVVTFTATCSLGAAASGPLVNTVTAAVPANAADPVASNDAATDTDVVLVAGACGAFDRRHLSHVTLAGSETVEACTSIAAGPAVVVASDVLFRSPLVAISELSVTGGSLTVSNETPTP